jgi:hypothetical protein
MTDDNSIHDFSREVDCAYKEERYSVRDNGVVLRHPRANQRQRSNDNKWTYGNPNDKTGYMEIASVRVHRIVATAFHGIPPTQEHVVDHIDTNKRNNRPENLRWVTRLENVLLNPITARKIEIVCGSVESFLADPLKFRDKFQQQDYKWMSSVSVDEAQSSYKRLLEWAKSDKLPSGGKLGEWIFTRAKSPYTRTNTARLSIDEIFEKVEKEKGVNRTELSSKSKKHKNLNARIYAAKLLRSEIGLSDERIGELVGRSPSMVNTYMRW